MPTSQIRARSEYDNEDEFRDELGDILWDKEIRQSGHSQDDTEWARITNVKINKKHPSRRGRPDLQVYHSGFDLGWRKLSNPFFIECKNGFGFQDDLLQLLRYKYEKDNEIDLEKYGKYHVGCASPTTTKTDELMWPDEGYPSYYQFERTLWHLGVGLLRKEHNRGEFRLTFNEREQATIY